MKWSEVRKMYPNKFVYHTQKEELSMEIVNMPILRGKARLIERAYLFF